MLRVSVLGNLGADPEMRQSQKGTLVATFRVAANQVRMTAEGERQETTEWFRVRATGRLAESCQRLARGGRVLVVGRLEIARFQSREGEPKVGFDVWADEVVNLSPRPDPEVDPASAIEPVEEAAPAAPSPAPRLRSVESHGARPVRPARRAAPEPAEELDALPF